MPQRHRRSTRAAAQPCPRALPLFLPIALAALLAACGSGTDDSATRTARSAHALAESAPETVLTPVGASASDQERADLSAQAAIDHDMGTRWGSAFRDDQWLTLDYGHSVAINHVRIAWEAAHASQYLLQVSDDNTHWTTIKSVDANAGGSEEIAGLNGQGRYLRMQGVKRSTQ